MGDSLAVNGICLTVTGVRRDLILPEAAAETRRVTTLLRWRPGDRLHLEPALRVGEALDGHWCWATSTVSAGWSATNAAAPACS